MLNPFAGTKDWAWSRWQGGQARVAPDRDLGQNYAYVLEKETEKSFEMIMGLLSWLSWLSKNRASQSLGCS